jgi:hypothetical protein
MQRAGELLPADLGGLQLTEQERNQVCARCSYRRGYHWGSAGKHEYCPPARLTGPRKSFDPSPRYLTADEQTAPQRPTDGRDGGG